jgi:hypothetical protein
MTDIRVGMFVTRLPEAGFWYWWGRHCDKRGKPQLGGHKVVWVSGDSIKLEGFDGIGFSKNSFTVYFDPSLETKELEDYL